MRIFFILVLFLLSACAGTPPVSGNKHYAQHRQQLQAVRDWQAQGSVSLRHGTARESAYFAWRQCHENYQLNLFGPLGSHNTQLRGNKNQVVLLTPDKRRLTAKNPEALLMQQLGWTVPISDLYYWIRGIEVPHQATILEVDQFNRLRTLRQQGWKITYLEYMQQDKIILPTRILLENAQWQVRVNVHEWHLSHCS